MQNTDKSNIFKIVYSKKSGLIMYINGTDKPKNSLIKFRVNIFIKANNDIPLNTRFFKL